MNKASLSRALRIGSLIGAGIAAVVQTVAIVTVYDNGTNYFLNSAVLPTVALAIALLACAAGIVAAILSPVFDGQATVFSVRLAPSPATVGFLISAAFVLFYRTKTAQPTVGLAAALLLLCGMVYTLLVSVPAWRQSKNRALCFGMLGILGTILINAYYYFDVSIEMNAPIKVTTQMGLLFATVYLTGELRFLLGTQKPRVFVALATALASIGSLCSFSLLVAFFLGKTDRADYVAGALLVLCILLSALLRVRTLYASPEASQNADENAEVEE